MAKLTSVTKTKCSNLIQREIKINTNIYKMNIIVFFCSVFLCLLSDGLLILKFIYKLKPSTAYLTNTIEPRIHGVPNVPDSNLKCSMYPMLLGSTPTDSRVSCYVHYLYWSQINKTIDKINKF